MTRIGLLGGSFDPVHLAHLALARCALDALRLDGIRWIPAGDPWQKRSRAPSPAADREAMLRLAIAGEPRYAVERCELERAGPSYTVDTVAELRAREPGVEWFLIVGQDQWARFDTWHRWQDVLRDVTIAVAGRAGEAPCAPAAVMAENPRVVEVPLPAMAVSSTDIRARAAAGLPLDALVPAAVAGYIERRRLYRHPTRS